LVNCAGCTTYPCYRGEKCVRGQDLSKYVPLSRREYDDPVINKIAEVAARIEGEHYLEYTRLEEIIAFCREMGYRQIGIAHCVGLTREAKLLRDILKDFFAVEAVCCKFSGIDKKELQFVQVDCDVYEAICNPAGQAMVLNDLKTDLNIAVGLCIGHDILFAKYSEAPVTTFIVKDRVTGHNPAVMLYSGYAGKKLAKMHLPEINRK